MNAVFRPVNDEKEWGLASEQAVTGSEGIVGWGDDAHVMTDPDRPHGVTGTDPTPDLSQEQPLRRRASSCLPARFAQLRALLNIRLRAS